jgi:integrase
LDAKPLAPSVANRRRKILYTTLQYAVTELKALDINPMSEVKFAVARRVAVREVDKRVVANPIQARTLLEAVRMREHRSHLTAYFGVQYYGALRPEEAVALNAAHLSLPPANWDTAAGKWVFVNDGWGELHVETAEPWAGKEWTDSGAARDIRHLKQREAGEIRLVPCCPELTVLLYDHMRLHGTAPDGRLFVGKRNKGELPKRTILDTWDDARRDVFTDEVYAGPVAATPYDLRHACVSTWLNGGVPPTTVALWAGHSVEVLLRIYAKCLAGELASLRARVEAALGHQAR